jgi:hypothetical protein
MALVLAFGRGCPGVPFPSAAEVCDLAFLASKHRHEMGTYVLRIAARTPTFPRRKQQLLENCSGTLAAVADNKFGRESAAE